MIPFPLFISPANSFWNFKVPVNLRLRNSAPLSHPSQMLSIHLTTFSLFTQSLSSWSYQIQSYSPLLLKLWKDCALKGDCLHCPQKKISHLSLPCVVTASVRKLEGKTSCAQLVRKESQGYSNRFYAIMTIRISVRSPNCCCTRAIMIVKVWFCDFKNIIEWNHWPLWPRGEDTGRLTAIHMARLWLGWKRNTGIAYC